MSYSRFFCMDEQPFGFGGPGKVPSEGSVIDVCRMRGWTFPVSDLGVVAH